VQDFEIANMESTQLQNLKDIIRIHYEYGVDLKNITYFEIININRIEYT